VGTTRVQEKARGAATTLRVRRRQDGSARKEKLNGLRVLFIIQMI